MSLFSSRYTTNLGRIQVLLYGSKHLYTNTDLTSTGSNQVAGNTLIKVGAQEFRVDTAASNKLILDEPYLGASIQPVTVDTGIFGLTAADASSFTKSTVAAGTADTSDRIKVTGVVTAEMVLELGEGAQLYVNDCAVTVNKYKTALGGDTITAAEEEISASTYTSGSPGFIGIVAEVDKGTTAAAGSYPIPPLRTPSSAAATTRPTRTCTRRAATSRPRRPRTWASPSRAVRPRATSRGLISKLAIQ